MRCGNLGRAGNKGYDKMQCRLCGWETEDLEHIWNCEKFRNVVNPELERRIGKIMEGHRGREWKKLLSGPIQAELCEYSREFEKEARDQEKFMKRVNMRANNNWSYPTEDEEEEVTKKDVAIV
ncbi:hypothetical protein KPH14_012261 [Odynerus spinipes]|uniref:Uncharacterized protein n=1 Tax=Odynerus spinipes TaxID=1348599 RepID=A0AAD9RDY6_9HYME|nr:hypothetical protein KPH14_012261 [Odynerus spinipes]